MAKCRCRTKSRIVSNVVRSMKNESKGGCQDVCANPICGEPDILGIMAPVIYDEIGINLCTTFALGVDISTEYPTATSASIRAVGATYEYGSDGVLVEAITGRSNCYVVTLSNITIQFTMNLYDAARRLVGTINPTALYLPSETSEATYDEDTNPASVELEIFAPYGLSLAADNASPVIQYIGFNESNNYLRQGLNLFGMAKLLDFNIDDDEATVGLTLVLQSLYYAGYKVPTNGKIDIPKGSIISPEDSDCMRFVAGDLLNLEIKPLDLGAPYYEEQFKQDCSPGFDCVQGNGGNPGHGNESTIPENDGNSGANGATDDTVVISGIETAEV